MKATEAKLLEFLKKSPHLVIPIYQRAYSWTERECSQLWEDIIRTGRNDKISAHFVGSIVYIEEGLYNVSSQSPLLVIDGQQRLTTVSLILEALARQIKDTEPFDGFSAKKIRHYFLQNPLESGDRKYKLLLSQTDNDTLRALIDNNPKPKDTSIRISDNFKLFQKWIADTDKHIDSLCKGLSKLIIVDISLSRDQDNPQLIFESLNSTGKELSQADLIRNYILMGLDHELQSKLYKIYWRPMEVEFGQEAYSDQFDSFMRHYLTVKTGVIPNVRKVYEAFKLYSKTTDIISIGIEALVKDISLFSNYYCSMALNKESDSDLKTVFNDIRELKVDVAYPLLLVLYDDYKNKILLKSDFLKIVRLIEAYVFRRSVCGIPTNSLNKTFATFSKSIDKADYIGSVASHFVLLPSYRRFPNNDEFMRDFKTKDLYNYGNRSFWLKRIENYNRKERVQVDHYIIEHIMPQNEQLSDSWKKELGNDWERIHQTWLHTLGNLTLTGYNSEYSDKSFKEKRDMEGGFKTSPLRLNEGLGSIEKWDEDSIKNRANTLSKLVIAVWSYPSISSENLKKYKKEKEKGQEYSINEHPFLLREPVKSLFEKFAKEVRAIDPCVTVEFLKLYVAFKAETNFVDIVPQSKILKLTLNMKFHEINDPKGMCTDVSNLGRWGNGDIEVVLSSINDLPYILSLVRQSFEKQMGDLMD